MNKATIKGLVIGAAITALLVWKWHNMKVEAMENSYNDQLAALQALQETSSESAKKNVEFAEIGEDCELIKQFKMSLNFLGGASYFDELPTLSAEDSDKIMPLLKNTTHFLNENNGLRKSFLYDFNKTVANVLEVTDFPIREFNYEYSSGVINKGDKGSDVNKLQELLNLILYKEEPMQVTGTYDKEMYDVVIKTFKGITALIDEGSGTLSKEFVNNFSIIIGNLTYQYVENTDLGEEV